MFDLSLRNARFQCRLKGNVDKILRTTIAFIHVHDVLMYFEKQSIFGSHLAFTSDMLFLVKVRKKTYSAAVLP